MPLDLRAAPQSFLSRREPSLAQHDRHRSIYPTLTFEIPLPNWTHEQLQSDLLVGVGSTPSFPSSSGAFNAFFYKDFQVTGANMPSLGRIKLCFSDQRAHFAGVVVRPASLDVTAEGQAVAGTYLELNSASNRAMTTLTQAGDVALPLPDGLPSDAWLWIKQGAEWLDYRSLGGWPAYRSAGVEVETPDDPTANLSGLIAQGEGDQLEFKSKLPDSKEEKRTTFKTVVAFAIGNGGTLIFGVEDRTGRVLGIEASGDPPSRRFTDLLRDLVKPTPTFHASEQELDGKVLLIVDVDSSNGSLHALTIEANKPEFFIRRGATTFYARAEELEAVVASRQQNPASDSYSIDL